MSKKSDQDRRDKLNRFNVKPYPLRGGEHLRVVKTGERQESVSKGDRLLVSRDQKGQNHLPGTHSLSIHRLVEEMVKRGILWN
jgi:hypothetical protein